MAILGTTRPNKLAKERRGRPPAFLEKIASASRLQHQDPTSPNLGNLGLHLLGCLGPGFWPAPLGPAVFLPFSKDGCGSGPAQQKGSPCLGQRRMPRPQGTASWAQASPLPVATSPVQCRITTFSLNIFLPPPRSLRNPTIVFTISFFFLFFFLFFFIF